MLSMSRITMGRLGKVLEKSSRPIGGTQHVARLFIPSYDLGAINVVVRRSQNSDARRRLARIFDSRRVIS
jgi:hypothetical protein